MSRRRRTGIVMACVLAVVLFIRLDYGRLGRGRRGQAESAERAGIEDFERYHGGSFAVINVVDGDTLDIDAADANSPHTRIRLLGIDAPETRNDRTGVMYWGPESSEFAKKLTLGKQVRVYLDTVNNTRGRYGRLLAYVQLPGGEFLNEVLVADGFVYADLRFRHSFYNRYKQLEASARGSKKGLWENVGREQLPEWLQRKRPSLLRRK
ncbi:MAG: thermonuclease family protein [Phycisphaerales bacterium]|nr:MAG: thermonuclease family protein [Phycisphaerales bacterium]